MPALDLTDGGEEADAHAGAGAGAVGVEAGVVGADGAGAHGGGGGGGGGGRPGGGCLGGGEAACGLLGVGELAGAALTQRTPGDRSEEDGRAGVGTVSTPAPTAPAGADVPVNTDRGPDGLAPRTAPAPLETPGPSVTAPELPESETERAEWAEAHTPEMDFLAPTSTTDAIVAEEEAAAAAEAALIGGVVPHDSDDPAMDPVYQAGGGEAEGFEAAEEDLIENATHGDGGGDPIRDAIDVEAEADLSSAVYGEADRLPSTEVTFNPDAGPDDPGEGPGLAAERSEGVQPQPDEYQDRQ